MAKLYTVKEMAELLSQEFGENPANYEFTEERVRARLRSARARGTIKPQRMGYDRRTNYYSEEDFAKLRASWIGPELPEFTEYREDLDILNPEEEEIYVRAATVSDGQAILSLFPPFQSEDEKDAIAIYVSKMLKSSQNTNFVATLNETEIIGWAQAEISVPTSLLKHGTTGVIRIHAPVRKERPIAVRSLYHRAHMWLTDFHAQNVLVEVPADMADLEEVFQKRCFLEPETRILFMTGHEER
jgi:hypothetical protein